MIILMLFFTIIGSWRIATLVRDNRRKVGSVAEDELDPKLNQTNFVSKKKINLNRRTLIAQSIYGTLSLLLAF